VRDFSKHSTTPEEPKSDEYVSDPDFAQLITEAGCPLEFASTKGQHIDGQQNIEAARVGQIRRYQQFQGKKLKEWQIKRLRGVRLKQTREKSAVPR
jgi:hypothetical protein